MAGSKVWGSLHRTLAAVHRQKSYHKVFSLTKHGETKPGESLTI